MLVSLLNTGLLLVLASHTLLPAHTQRTQQTSTGFSGFVLNGENGGFPQRPNQFNFHQFTPVTFTSTTVDRSGSRQTFPFRSFSFDNTQSRNTFPGRTTGFDQSGTRDAFPTRAELDNSQSDQIISTFPPRNPNVERSRNFFPSRNAGFEQRRNSGNFPRRNSELDTSSQLITTFPASQNEFERPSFPQSTSQQRPSPSSPVVDVPAKPRAESGPLTLTPSMVRDKITESCLACICEASTSCNLTTRCVSGGLYCGPFLISQPYWTDAGRPALFQDTPDRDGAFSDCAVDPVCAAETVRNYMTKYQKDCNGDGQVDCDDLARIHLMGPFGTECASPQIPSTSFYNKFSTCWTTVQQLS